MSWAPPVHFVGIGGAGMSAIAKVLLERGIAVTGSDLKSSATTIALQEMGAKVDIGHDPTNLAGAAQVVVSAAISATNPEIARARELGLEIIPRGEALARLLAGTRSIVVAGTHGKTTTTSMIVSILHHAGRDPTYLVGGGLNDAGTNAASGADDLIVAESDESDGSFLLLAPSIAVVTNIEMDHVDHWLSLADLREAFTRFLERVDQDGTVVLPAGDDIAAAAAGRSVVTFGPNGDLQAQQVEGIDGRTAFVLVNGDQRSEVELAAPGSHNVMNALAAAGAARAIGLDVVEIAAGLNSFQGVERRFEPIGERSGIAVIDDYAHHPAEVRATLAAATSGPWDRVIAVFQPHRYSRTKALAKEFGPSFRDADLVVVTEVYGAGEAPIPGITGKLIADAVAERLPGRPLAYFPHRADVTSYLVSSARPGDLILTLGAGDVTSIGPELLERLGTTR